MDQMPINVVLFASIPEAIIIISLGLILIGIRPPWKNVILAAIFQSAIAYIVRKNVEFGMHTLILLATMTILVWLIIKVPFFKSFIGMLIGIIINTLVEGLFLLFIPKIIGISLGEIMSRSWLRIGVFLPQFSALCLLFYLCRKYNFTLEKEIRLLKVKDQK